MTTPKITPIANEVFQTETVLALLNKQIAHIEDEIDKSEFPSDVRATRTSQLNIALTLRKQINTALENIRVVCSIIDNTINDAYVDMSFLEAEVGSGDTFPTEDSIQVETPCKDKPESVRVLEECAELQLKKSRDYQNPNSKIKQADYYPRGLNTIIDIIWAKILRTRSVLDAMDSDAEYTPNFESIEDSLKDLINYSSFGISWLRGGIEGQQVEVTPKLQFVDAPLFEDEEVSEDTDDEDTVYLPEESARMIASEFNSLLVNVHAVIVADSEAKNTPLPEHDTHLQNLIDRFNVLTYGDNTQSDDTWVSLLIDQSNYIDTL